MLYHEAKRSGGQGTDWTFEILMSTLVGAALAALGLYVFQGLGYVMPSAYYALIAADGAASYLAGVGLRSRVMFVGEEEHWRWSVGLRHTRYRRALKIPRVKLWLLYCV